MGEGVVDEAEICFVGHDRRHQVVGQVRHQYGCCRIHHRSGTVERQIQLVSTGHRMRGAKGELFAHCIGNVGAVQAVGRRTGALGIIRIIVVSGGIPYIVGQEQIVQMGRHMDKARANEYPLRRPVDELVGQNLRMDEECGIGDGRDHHFPYRCRLVRHRVPHDRYQGFPILRFQKRLNVGLRSVPQGESVISRIGRKGKVGNRKWIGHGSRTQKLPC